MSKGLGLRGRDALFNSSVSIQDRKENDIYKEISLSSLSACAFQPRKHFDEENLQELAASIKEKGIVQPLVVRKLENNQYEIVAGERRYRAAKLIGLEKVPAIVREYSDAETMTIALVENIQRENLNPIEEAEAFKYLKETYNFSQEELAKSLGKSRPRIANALRLLNLPENIRAYLLDGSLSGAHGRTLLSMEDAHLIDEMAERIIQYKLSVRDTENIVDYVNAYHALPELAQAQTAEQESEQAENIEHIEEVKEEIVVADETQKAKNNAPKRRSMAKSEFFTSLQKQLRKEVHRGTTISGTLENGKIVLPFAGKDEFENLLRLLVLGGNEDILNALPISLNTQVVHNSEENDEDLHSTAPQYIENPARMEKHEAESFEDFVKVMKEGEKLDGNFDEKLGDTIVDDAIAEEAIEALKDKDETSTESSHELHAQLHDTIVNSVQSELSSEADLVGFPFDEADAQIDKVDAQVNDSVDSTNTDLPDEINVGEVIDFSEEISLESALPDSLDALDASFSQISEVLASSAVDLDNAESLAQLEELGFGEDIEHEEKVNTSFDALLSEKEDEKESLESI